ncbi:sterol desaturase family protein [Thalassomonas viridans]|uniref:Sterol desaturase family protein n=1 Tax=Thalassomonas viridans TaxID=137584 RepID=A0AAF0C6P9_9GAMM|nr:sterol desaturase family protein [Thalassomonas viridans]WDE04437.1 sterol desaturase family protein [Thalassomonas viridans]
METATHWNNAVFLVFLASVVALEALWLIAVRKKKFPWRESLANFSVAIIKRLIDLVTYGIAGGLVFWAYEYRVMTITVDNLATGIVYFLLFELAYYWHHRWAHKIRWLWATHSVHHSANHMNLSVAARLGWTGLLSGGVLVFMPLAVLGFHPLLIFVTLAISLFYQVFLHTELIGKLGPLEWFLNTPSHHRVHHGSNSRYLDKNFGGVLIIYDRLFATFAGEEEKVIYGLTRPLFSYNPVIIAFDEWVKMFRDLRRAQGIRQAFGFLFARPGWRPRVKAPEFSEVNAGANAETKKL